MLHIYESRLKRYKKKLKLFHNLSEKVFHTSIAGKKLHNPCYLFIIASLIKIDIKFD